MESVWTTKDIKVHKGKHPIGFNSARSVIYLTKVAGKPTAIFLLSPSCQDVQIFTSIQS